VGGYTVVVIAVSVFFWPMWTGIQIDWRYMEMHYWWPRWK
jgi:dolichyl-phosphate-mannose-protein mannosyltransferase